MMRRTPVLLLLAAISLVVTLMLADRVYPIGWIYLAQFFLAGLYAFAASGTFPWILAVWMGSLVGLILHQPQGIQGEPLSLLLISMQYLTACLSGGLAGQLLRHVSSVRLSLPRPVMPGPGLVQLSIVMLLLLPLLTFFLLADRTLSAPDMMVLLMFVPGNTPFLFPALLVSIFSGHWLVVQASLSAGMRQRTWGLLALSYLLLLAALFIKLVFGWLEVNLGVS